MSEELEWNMGNDNKIDKLEKSKAQFLPEAIEDFETEREVYSLEQEYSKTKKNRPWGLYLFIVGFIALVAGSTYFFSTFIENENREVNVHFSEFEDLRLKEVLDSAKGSDSAIEAARGALKALEVGMLEQILVVQNRYQRKELDIVCLLLNEKETDEKLSALRLEKDREIKRVRRDYALRIRSKRRDLEKIVSKKKKDERILKKEGDKATALSNYEKLYELRMKKVKRVNEAGIISLKRYHDNYSDYLIREYNPSFKSQVLREILAKRKNYIPAGDLRYLRAYNDVIASEGIYTRERFDDLRKKINEQGLLIKRLKNVPFRNSIPPSLEAIEGLSDSIMKDYESLWSGLAGVLQKKNRELDSFNYAFRYILKVKPESGYVIDSHNIKNIIVYMKRVHDIKDGGTALVFRNDDEYIGKLSFFKTVDGLRARAVETARGKAVQPFDKILLEKKQELP